MKQKPEILADMITRKIADLPGQPGVYQFLDENDVIIYVGKAKNIKKRVASYFNKESHDSGKTALLVKRIRDFRTIVVETEADALLLENSLIKEYQPKYNVQLKDDKSYPWICIKNERFPRIFGTRNLIRDGSEYFGPYTSVKMMNALLELVTGIYKLRNCNYNLSNENIEAGKFKVCLEYHIGNCKGPCEGLQSEEEYNESINQVREIIKGNISSVIRRLKHMMKEYSENLMFEKAHLLKERIDRLEHYQAKSTVVNPTIRNTDVFSIVSDLKSGFVNYMRIINGTIVQAHSLELKKKLDESDEELLSIAITDIRRNLQSTAKEMILPFRLETELPDVKTIVPSRGDKKHLLELSQRNAKYFQREKRKQEERVDPERHSKRILETLKKDLRLKELPVHIECFDNSNIQGSDPVAACVVFRNAKPFKKDYRHFNIKTVTGPNDFASMEEVIYRRYKRLLDEDKSLPQLIVIDGGKGQLSSAMKSLDKLELRGKMAVIGIAKKLEEIYFPNDPVPLYIDKRSESLKVIQHLRNEAHRFGITHHRKRRSKGTIKSELVNIEGIGENTAKKLLSHFKSVKRVREASLEELAKVVGKAKAAVVIAYFAK